MKLKNKSVLVTGGAGFIGSHVVDRLIKEEPENLVVVDNFFLGKESNLTEAKANRPSLKIFREDASDYEAMMRIFKDESIEVVFNLAVLPLVASLTKPRGVFEQNVKITMCMCELMRNDYYNTLIHFSSSEAYGTSEYVPMDEKHPLNGITPYAASKAASDHLVFSYYRVFGIDVSIIRPFNNYGPRQNEGSYAGVIPLTINRIIRGEPPRIYGDGQQTRDYLFVTDTSDAAITMYNMKNTRGKVLNIAGGREVTIETIITQIAKNLGYRGKIIYETERPGDVRRHLASVKLAEELIGFKQTVNLENGLRQTIDWYRKSIQDMDKES